MAYAISNEAIRAAVAKQTAARNAAAIAAVAGKGK